MASLPKVLIVDLGSQYTKVIERTVRELKVRSMILDPKKAAKLLESKPELSSIILSGSGRSTFDDNAPQPPESIFDTKVPILGICYGMQWLVKRLGGTLNHSDYQREYGKALIRQNGNEGLFLFDKTPHQQVVWASHGDSVQCVPEDWKIVAKSLEGNPVAVVNEWKTIWGVLFHPEVTHSEFGKKILSNFLFNIAHCEKDWQPSSMIDEICDSVNQTLGDRKAVLGFSGGVDSTTLTAILSPVLQDRLHCVTVDGGQFREGEVQEIFQNARHAGVSTNLFGLQKQFVAAISTSVDPEVKRKTFKNLYARVLTSADASENASALIQGTLAPDMIESGATGGETIKSHHNIGLKLPDGWLGLHPISHLFKSEVRALAKEVGLPESVWSREPFPGPGLFVRWTNDPVSCEGMNLLRWADARVREIVGKHPIAKKISQMPVSRIGKLVGVKGDERVFGEVIMVHPVQTVDYMTAVGIRFPEPLKDVIENTLIRHSKIVAVVFNEMNKPPCTIEPE